mmetsp:Transcript_4786/g.8503  ORF Transcript_4786/g.8503 Transcript_4786/m.8503 type:complete len:452 (-) Transcript_4786:65-1420(-)
MAPSAADPFLDTATEVPRSYTANLVHEQSIALVAAKSGSSVTTCCLNLVLSTVGVGALTLPWSTAQIGWLQSFLLLFLFFFVSVYNLYLLDSVCRHIPSNANAGETYASIVAFVLGRSGAYALEASMLLYSFGLSVSYLGVVGNELSVLLSLMEGEGATLKPNDLMAMVAVFVVLPMSLLPDTLLRLAGAVGTLCMLFTTAVVVSQVPWQTQPPFVEACADAVTLTGSSSKPMLWIASMPALLDAVPMFTFCMNAATAFVSIRSQLDSATGTQPPKGSVVSLIWLAQVLALLDYVVSLAAGYASFCQASPDNVLDGYPVSHLPTLMARLALALQLSAACAGVYIPLARAALYHLLMGIDVGAPRGTARALASVALISGMVMAAYALDGALALPLGLTSAVCTTAMMFVFPGLCAYRVQLPGAPMLSRVTPLVFAAIGLLIGVASTVSLLDP